METGLFEGFPGTVTSTAKTGTDHYDALKCILNTVTPVQAVRGRKLKTLSKNCTK